MISGEIFSSPTALKNTFRVSFLKKTAEDPVNIPPPPPQLNCGSISQLTSPFRYNYLGNFNLF